MKKILSFVPICLLLVSMSTVSAQTALNYFPLTVGDSWVYEDTIRDSSESSFDKLVITNEGVDTVLGVDCFRLKSESTHHDTTSLNYNWYRIDSRGNLLWCSMGLSDKIRLLDFNPPYIKLGHNTGTKGSKWQYNWELLNEVFEKIINSNSMNFTRYFLKN